MLKAALGRTMLRLLGSHPKPDESAEPIARWKPHTLREEGAMAMRAMVFIRALPPISRLLLPSSTNPLLSRFAVVYGTAPFGLLLLLPVAYVFEHNSLESYVC